MSVGELTSLEVLHCILSLIPKYDNLNQTRSEHISKYIFIVHPSQEANQWPNWKVINYHMQPRVIDMSHALSCRNDKSGGHFLVVSKNQQ